jgi:diguanylate cyclase (GGDEF)-like protein
MKSINNGDMNIRLQIKGKVEYDRITDAFNTLLDNALISEELYRTISNISGNTLFEWDSQKGAMFTSNDFNHIFNVNLKSATLSNGNFIDSLMGPTEAERYRQDISKLIKTGSELFGEYLITTKQNKHLWFSVRAKCITNRVGELQRVIGFITNIDNEKKLNLQLSERASYDFLTKLYNRNTFLRLLKTELERTAMPKIAVLFVDIDDFKNINDKYGHGTGDEIIKYVSSAVKAELKNNGFAGRFGGDEFVMCVTNPYMVDRVEELASDLLGIYNEGFFSELINTKLKIKISIGIAKSPEHGKTTDSIIAAADEAMYFVKKHGKSNYHVYDPIDINLSNMM